MILSGFTSCFKKSNIPFIYTAFLKNKSLNIGDFILRMTINVLKWSESYLQVWILYSMNKLIFIRFQNAYGSLLEKVTENVIVYQYLCSLLI